MKMFEKWKQRRHAKAMEAIDGSKVIEKPKRDNHADSARINGLLGELRMDVRQFAKEAGMQRAHLQRVAAGKASLHSGEVHLINRYLQKTKKE